MYDRLERLIKEDIKKLTQAHVALIGLGGVGGYVFECLIRSGLEKITIIDPDVFEQSNFNRQMLATKETLQSPKVEGAIKRVQEINSQIKIIAHQVKLDEENITSLLKEPYDMIIDACDDIKAKIALIKYAKINEIPMITCLGTANRFNPTKLTITTLEKTYNDPLARSLRNKLPKEYHKTPVVWSEELPVKCQGLGTICPVPMAAGAILASYTFEKILQKKLI